MLLAKEAHTMHAWEGIQKSLDIIENRIAEETPIEELAKAT